ncbi:hypothetical protein I2485_04150 [Nesterenkonia sp. E16_7]|uniref:hypothetical protein n=1 Tax=unclassified Nesterenkonia TaxID=2629769 RepID=UPI001A917D3F|nr:MULTISPECIES: hypothetical protein [unclassified Nesterenkonia]MBO0596492.1 hypothetical protein [Nesterenkonia sp. E16_10]MBO0597838.1 hypothetical protein [Nesterenkonia sp. E16_7]
MTETPSRREELLAGALAGDLSDEERREFDRARAADPSIDAELAELRATAARMKATGVAWREEPPPPGLEERILAETSEADRLTRSDENGKPAP